MKKIVLLLLLVINFISCEYDDNVFNGETISYSDDQFMIDNFGATISANFSGKITNQKDEPLNGVKITIGNKITFTDHNGVFILNNADVYEKHAFIISEKNGYLMGSRTLIPSLESNNDVQIKLLEKNIIGSVNTGDPSEVILPNGAKVEFSGDFIDSNGNKFAGQVDVSMHYLEPNKESTFLAMPGNLFGRRENNSPSAMETYGMVSVELSTSSGEQLNISPESPAKLTFPISGTTQNAPNVIPLWYFDNENGYWREQGVAYKDGANYSGEVTHFSWWNCDVPFDLINVCFNVKNINNNHYLYNYKVELIREETGQKIFSGILNEKGRECGLFPKDEVVIVNVYGTQECNNTLIHSEKLGGFSKDKSINIMVSNLSIESTKISATLKNCNDNLVANGYALIYKNNSSIFSDVVVVSIQEGKILTNFSYCSGEEYYMVLYDKDTSQISDPMQVNLDANGTDLGVISVCGNESGGVYIGNIKFNDQSEINNFGVFGYTAINGNVRLGTDYDPSTNITDFSPFSTVITISGYLEVNDGPSSFNGFQSLTTIGKSIVLLYSDIKSFSGLENLVNLGGFHLEGTPISDFQGLEKIEVIDGTIYLQDMDISFNGLNNLHTIKGDLSLFDNTISSFEGLENLTSVHNFDITDGYSLVSLNGLENLITANDITIGIYGGNNTLSDYCALKNLINNGTYNSIQISGNLYNPTVSDITDGNCAQ